MDYSEVIVHCPDSIKRDILTAELAELGFDSFLEEKEELKAYIPTENLVGESLNEIFARLDCKPLSINHIPHQNWNETWEKSYEPIVIGERLFVGATFHNPPEGFEYIIQIDPNMSFGTGHHPTTYLMLEWMLKQDLKEKSFFDFGAGSGILSILASKMGASGEGVEIDQHATEAAMYNLKLNGVDNVEVRTGDLSETKNTFDVILANINRNIILERIETLKGMLRNGGVIVCSGFLSEDFEKMNETLKKHSLELIDQVSKDNWLMLTYKEAK